MDSLRLARLLDGLCHAEKGSLIPRLHESHVFVSWASADEDEAVEKMMQDEQEHILWLVTMINDLGESPTPARPDARATSFHYVALNYFMPLVTANKETLIRTYERTAPELSASPAASELAGRILDRHKDHLQQLRDMTQAVRETKGQKPSEDQPVKANPSA